MGNLLSRSAYRREEGRQEARENKGSIFGNRHSARRNRPGGSQLLWKAGRVGRSVRFDHAYLAAIADEPVSGTVSNACYDALW